MFLFKLFFLRLSYEDLYILDRSLTVYIHTLSKEQDRLTQVLSSKPSDDTTYDLERIWKKIDLSLNLFHRLQKLIFKAERLLK